MEFLILMALFGAPTAEAMRVDDGNNKTVYFDEAGKKLDAIDAFRQAMNDKKILQCTYVEAVGNQRTGKVNLKKKQ